jgi:hypothetical protein
MIMSIYQNHVVEFLITMIINPKKHCDTLQGFDALSNNHPTLVQQQLVINKSINNLHANS